MTAARPLDQEWFSSSELAALQLRDLPITRKGITEYAESHGWNADPARCRDRAGRGGGLEYHLSLIPTLSWADYHRRTMVVGEVAPIRPQPALPTPETERARVTQAARLAILTALERYGAGLNVREEGRVFAFVGAYNMGHLKVDDWVREAVPSVSKRSLFRWRAEAKAGKSLGFDRSLARKGKGVLDLANGGKVAAWIMMLVASTALSAKAIRRDLRAVFGDELMMPSGELVAVPSVRMLQHWVKNLKTEKQVALTALSNPDKYRSHFRPSGTDYYSHIRDLNDLWMIDASPVDALCFDGRHSIYACIDIASRRTIWYVSRTPRASAVGLLIRKAIVAWGICRQIKTDNGSDFKAIQTQQLFHDLGIDVEYCPPYTPQQKGHVERAIKTFQHDCGPLLPGYIGHDVTERKAIEDRKSFADRLGEETAEAFAVSMTGAQLQRYIDDWNSLIYEQSEHEGLDGRSPAQAAMESTTVIRRVDERALDVLLMPIAGKNGIRTYTKTGVPIGKAKYLIMEALPKDRLMIRMDPHDAGLAYAFDAETGRFVGEAICAKLRGIAPATLIKTKREMQAERISEQTAPAKRANKESQALGPLIERALEVARRDMPNVVALPKREERHTTPAIEAAIEAASPRPPAARPNEAEVRATMDRLTAQVHAEVFPVPPSSERIRPLRPTETREQRFRKWLQLEARRIAGDDLSFAEANWMGSYQTDSEWKAMKRLYDAGATF